MKREYEMSKYVENALLFLTQGVNIFVLPLERHISCHVFAFNASFNLQSHIFTFPTSQNMYKLIKSQSTYAE